MNAHETYQKYMALKRHFTSDYDIFKYNGKVKNTEHSRFEVRRDKMFFHKLSKLKNPDDFMLANMLQNINFWPGDINNMETHAVYANWQKRQQSMSYMFKQDLMKLKESYDENILTKGDTHPYLMRLVIREDVGVETMIVMNELTPFFDYWTKKLGLDMVWQDLHKKAEKYKPFFINTVDLSKYKSYIMERFE
tara:strand:+ start:614 stop:1192 length:579 start_codon:yes stop_codon:yes gene_type:complete